MKRLVGGVSIALAEPAWDSWSKLLPAATTAGPYVRQNVCTICIGPEAGFASVGGAPVCIAASLERPPSSKASVRAPAAGVWPTDAET